jgi:hypothetical protein
MEEENRRLAQLAVGPGEIVTDYVSRNLEVIVQEAKGAGLVVACWGAIATDTELVEQVVGAITTGVAPWPRIYVFGLTGNGAPIHPMARGKHRISDDAKPILWRDGTV